MFREDRRADVSADPRIVCPVLRVKLNKGEPTIPARERACESVATSALDDPATDVLLFALIFISLRL